ELGDAESRRTDQNGVARAAIWELRTKRVVTICRSPRKRTQRAMFIVARIAKKNFHASAEFAARSRAWLVAENIMVASSIRDFGSNSRRSGSGVCSQKPNQINRRLAQAPLQRLSCRAASRHL